MAAELAPYLRTSSPVGAVARKGGRFVVSLAPDARAHGGPLLEADAVVLACPSHAAGRIVADLAAPVAHALEGIVHAPVEVVCLGYEERALGRPLRAFGVLVPRREGLRSLGTLCSDQIFPGQAPPGMRLLRTLLGGAHDPGVVALDEQGLYDTVERDLDELFETRGTPPHFRRIIRHERGIAQYTLGHQARVARLDALERELPGLFFAGASYRGVSINGCVKGAFDVARRVGEVALGIAGELPREPATAARADAPASS
jgi:oxygen-dependent protoporphyrinogen oxidase